MPPAEKKILHKYPYISVDLPNWKGNGGELGIARCEKMGDGIEVSNANWKWVGNGNEVIKVGGIWYEKSVSGHL